MLKCNHPPTLTLPHSLSPNSPSHTHDNVVVERRSQQAMNRSRVSRDCILWLRTDQLATLRILLRLPVSVDHVTVLRAGEELRVDSFHLGDTWCYTLHMKCWQIVTLWLYPVWWKGFTSLWLCRMHSVESLGYCPVNVRARGTQRRAVGRRLKLTK